MAITLADLAARLEGRVQGDPDREVCRIGSLGAAGSGAIAFFDRGRPRNELEHTRAGAVILGAADAAGYPGNCILVDDPYVAFAKAASIVHTVAPTTAGIHATAVVGPGASVAQSASIGPNSAVGDGAMRTVGVWQG